MVVPLDLPPGPPLPTSPPLSPPPLSRNATIRPHSTQLTGSPRRSPGISGSGWGTPIKGSPQLGMGRPLSAVELSRTNSTPSAAQLDLTLVPLSPLPSHLAPFLHPISPLSSIEKRNLFTSTYLRAASAGNSETLEWLLSIPPDPSLSSQQNAANARRFSLTAAQLNNADIDGLPFHSPPLGTEQVKKQEELSDLAPRKWVDLEATDEEGNTALGLCVALGHSEAVRVLVESGVRVTQPDQAGWTPLHWAVQNNDIPIASYLLNHRASPLIASHKGLTPRDLVKPGTEGIAMREVLKSAWEAAVERERARMREMEEFDESAEGKELAGGSSEGPTRRSESRLSVASSIAEASWLEDQEKAAERVREKERKKRLILAMDSARNLDIDVEVLGLGESNTALEEDEDSDSEGIQNPFEWGRCLPDQMIVFTLDDLPTLFDVVITTIKPTRRRKYRVIPANVLFLSARFAHHWGTPELLEELVIGAMERIEAAVHNRPDDMTNCAFWLSNTLLFLYYLRKEPSLARSTANYQLHLCDLINEIFVFVIRDAERRIDRVLEAAMLEHEPLAGFEDVAFEGEWGTSRFVKKLTGRGRKASNNIRSSTSAMSLFSVASGGDGGGSIAGDTSFDSVGSTASPSRTVSASFVPPSEATPASITALLASTLFILQIYQIPPSIIVQAFSQLFYWISCEIFNRLLSQRKYLCRSRAMQIRLNASNLEDWARANRFPTKMVSVHFAPLNHLLQWLQCLSSESSIDGLIGTIQSLRSLNPLQLRRAVRDYRYEVDETKMDEECAQYLVQIQKQWERQRMQKTVDGLASPPTPGRREEMEREAAMEEAASATSLQEDAVRMIAEVFSDPNEFGSYSPPRATEALGELLNSRYMLPFAVPSSAEMLINFDQPDAFGPFAPSRSRTNTSGDGTTTPRSLSRLSFTSSSRRSTIASRTDLDPDSSTLTSPNLSLTSSSELKPKEPFVPLLPDDFFAVWDAAKARAARSHHGVAALEGGGGISGSWQSWRDHMPGEESESGSDLEGDGDDDEEAEGSVIYRSGTGEGNSSFESDGGVMETPRPRSGFQ
ncbi:uncharacterized protein JCM6883_002308 [Sporobolomyces salmoneus]|uniref:uncharacterized protein n=1 Tax=Sporobolomyces salmoneus TaxID=183962 RepID=UPI00317CB701